MNKLTHWIKNHQVIAFFVITFAFFPNLDWMVYSLTTAVAALVMIVADRMWKKLPADHPAVY